MSECVSLSRPTRVLSVIPVTGARFFTSESNQPNMPPLTGFPLEVIDTPFESTDALAAGPKHGSFLSSTGFLISLAHGFLHVVPV